MLQNWLPEKILTVHAASLIASSLLLAIVFHDLPCIHSWAEPPTIGAHAFLIEPARGPPSPLLAAGHDPTLTDNIAKRAVFLKWHSLREVFAASSYGQPPTSTDARKLLPTTDILGDPGTRILVHTVGSAGSVRSPTKTIAPNAARSRAAFVFSRSATSAHPRTSTGTGR
jgi:hypothetical protein